MSSKNQRWVIFWFWVAIIWAIYCIAYSIYESPRTILHHALGTGSIVADLFVLLWFYKFGGVNNLIKGIALLTVGLFMGFILHWPHNMQSYIYKSGEILSIFLIWYICHTPVRDYVLLLDIKHSAQRALYSIRYASIYTIQAFGMDVVLAVFGIFVVRKYG